MTKAAQLAGVAALVVIVGGGAFFATKGTSDPAVGSGDVASLLARVEAGTEADLDGDWSLRSDAPNFVGYRIEEQLSGQSVSTAVGRSKAVIAAAQVNDGMIAVSSVTMRADSLVSDRVVRDRKLRTSALETAKYPEAKFELDQKVPVARIAGTAKNDVDITGQLTLHGVTKPVSVNVEVQSKGGTIAVVGKFPVKLSDFAIEKPVMAGLVSVADSGVVEFQLAFGRDRSAATSTTIPAPTTAPTAAPTTVTRATPRPSTVAPPSTGVGAVAPAGVTPTIQLANSSLGRILVDSAGRTLYLYGLDPLDTTVCYGPCATAWPPLLVTAPPLAGIGIDPVKLGTVVRQDGTTQVTYNGRALYFWVGDHQPGDLTGQDVDELWYVLDGAGNLVG